MTQTIQTTKFVATGAGQSEHEEISKLFFLFTPRQIEEVVAQIVIRPLPFAPSFLQGITLWRGHLLPVIDLKQRFNFSEDRKTKRSRFLITRTGAPENPVAKQILRCVLQVSDEIYSSLDADTSSLIDCQWDGVESSLVRGTYQWNNDMYIIPNLVSILQPEYSIDI